MSLFSLLCSTRMVLTAAPACCVLRGRSGGRLRALLGKIDCECTEPELRQLREPGVILETAFGVPRTRATSRAGFCDLSGFGEFEVEVRARRQDSLRRGGFRAVRRGTRSARRAPDSRGEAVGSGFRLTASVLNPTTTSPMSSSSVEPVAWGRVDASVLDPRSALRAPRSDGLSGVEAARSRSC
jgi:hypothetical protein